MFGSGSYAARCVASLLEDIDLVFGPPPRLWGFCRTQAETLDALRRAASSDDASLRRAAPASERLAG
jgi:hypothetical protein